MKLEIGRRGREEEEHRMCSGTSSTSGVLQKVELWLRVPSVFKLGPLAARKKEKVGEEE